MKRREIVILAGVFLLLLSAQAHACPGRLFNPITDIDYKGFFPVTVGGFTVAGFGQEDTPPASDAPVCFCPDRPPPLDVLPGIPVSFWEPVYLIEVVRNPYCFPSLGGMDLSQTIQGFGTNSRTEEYAHHHAFYHVHFYAYPAFYLLKLANDFACLQRGEFDLGYITELDPLWNSPELAALLTPELFLFANPASIAVCAADCAAATAAFRWTPSSGTAAAGEGSIP